LTEVYVSGGPGSFTGLRLGITVARMLVWAGHGRVRAVRVPTLEVIAQNCLETPKPPKDLVVLLDAKRGRVYAATFTLDQARYRRVTEPAERKVAELASTLPDRCAAVGEGIAYHRTAVDRARLTVLPEELNRPRAEVVHALGFARAAAGDFDGPAALVPIYVRRPEAEEVWERRHKESEPGPHSG
ncbi:MAG TPA: tRNA (adenosine(37)-N6)-threonylcarbamoyltransferase complex dimerization subunit type 1 TsaB, partial [Phycisphaerae bacterium]|nr:tRNA (adenosine(37)-N6)-threonylcarbamoyltransferase complex dimerization subunit type 1 TsaB [Phycisphaerae bacterium]